MLKLNKVAVVGAIAAGVLAAGAGTASAAQSDHPGVVAGDHDFSFTDAFNQFNIGGGALGYGAASLVSGAYAGIATTPALILHSLR